MWGSGSVFPPSIIPTEKAVRGALLHVLAPSKRQVLSPPTHSRTSCSAFLRLPSCCPSAQNALPHPLCKESPGISTPSSLQTSFGPLLMCSECTVRNTLASLSYVYHCIVAVCLLSCRPSHWERVVGRHQVILIYTESAKKCIHTLRQENYENCKINM